ncbi:hypothetical protein [Candidatus Villigracilis saccharophilus]|uniref:hypothetical protein n=1 Tax=Candidatus Villigracilis saccharophilus TaxID=3140684 RepID=UPI0031359958|nr:hypothetical protein [Anaerolineales bacterium]
MSIIIGNREILLGEILDLVAEKFNGHEKLPSYGGWPNYRFVDTSIFDIPALVTEIRAPFHDRQITQQTFELSLTSDSAKNLQKDYLGKIGSFIGDPIEVKEFDVSTAFQVSLTARWLVEDISITLSIYGGSRIIHHGISTAGLFFHITNEIEIAKPYVKTLEAMERSFWAEVNHFSIIQSVQINHRIRPYCLPNYASKNPESIYDDPLLRRAQKALYKKSLLDTPYFILEGMTENTIRVWTNNGRFFVSTLFDTAEFGGKDDQIEIHDLLPAKGSGQLSININDLSLSDSHGSKGLNALISTIETITKKKYPIYQDYDS